MKRFVASLLLCTLTVAAAGCSHPQQVDPDRPGSAPTNQNAGPGKDNSAQADPNNKEGTSQDALQQGAGTKAQITTAIVRNESVPDAVSAYGTVTGGANSQVSLAFPEAGRISRVYVTVGQRVQAGQALAQLDTGPFAADVAQATAAFAAAQANYQKAVAGARPQQIAQTSSQISSAQTQLAVARSNLDRQHHLLRLGIASQSDVDAAKGAVSSAQSKLQVLEQQQSAQVHPWQPDVAAAQAGVSQAAAALAASRQRLAYATLDATVSGTVAARLHNEGETVDPTTPVIQLANGAPQVFTAQFTPGDAEKIHRGDVATIEAQGSNDSTAGHVIAINSSQSTDTRSIPVLIRLDSNTLALGPGAYGTASITTGLHRGLVVPTVAIVRDPTTGSSQVFRKEGDHFTPTPVNVKQNFGGKSWIQSPDIKAGDIIAAQGSYELITPAQSGSKDPDAK